MFKILRQNSVDTRIDVIKLYVLTEDESFPSKFKLLPVEKATEKCAVLVNEFDTREDAREALELADWITARSKTTASGGGQYFIVEALTKESDTFGYVPNPYNQRF